MTTDHMVTFGQQYRTEQHPTVLPSPKNRRPHPDGYVVITGATDTDDAIRVAFGLFGARWSGCHVVDPDAAAAYPNGVLATYDATASRWVL